MAAAAADTEVLGSEITAGNGEKRLDTIGHNPPERHEAIVRFQSESRIAYLVRHGQKDMCVSVNSVGKLKMRVRSHVLERYPRAGPAAARWQPRP